METDSNFTQHSACRDVPNTTNKRRGSGSRKYLHAAQCVPRNKKKCIHKCTGNMFSQWQAKSKTVVNVCTTDSSDATRKPLCNSPTGEEEVPPSDPSREVSTTKMQHKPTMAAMTPSLMPEEPSIDWREPPLTGNTLPTPPNWMHNFTALAKEMVTWTSKREPSEGTKLLAITAPGIGE